MQFYLFILAIYFITMFLIITIFAIERKDNKNNHTKKTKGITQSGEVVLFKEPQQQKVNPKDVDKIVRDYMALNLKLSAQFIDTLYDCLDKQEVFASIDAQLKKRA